MSYRDWLNDRKVPRGPWVVDENGKALNAKGQDDEVQDLSRSSKVISLASGRKQR
jgi:hypothetical protein